MKIREVHTLSEAETEQAGEELGRRLGPGAVVALFGDLGVGKTAFVRGLVRATGYDGRVTSPTFSIVNEYYGNIPVFHFDMYRLRDEDDLYDLGWEDYLSRGGICAVEWSERVKGALPNHSIYVTLTSVGETVRIMRIEENHCDADPCD